MAKQTKSHFVDITDSTFQIIQRQTEKLPAHLAKALHETKLQSEERTIAFGTVLIPSLLEQATNIYHRDKRRAVIIFDHCLDEMSFIYLPQEHLSDLDWVLPQTLADISSLLKAYDPSCEASIIMLAPDTLQVVWVRDNGNLHSSGPQPLASIPKRPFALKAQELIDEMAAMHSVIHQHDEMPSTVTEKQAAKLKTEMQNSLQSLIIKGIAPLTIELSLFYHWLKITTLVHGHKESISDKLSENFADIMAQLVKHIEKTSITLKDAGPSQHMQALGAKIQEIKDIRTILAENKLRSHQEIRQHTETTNEEIFYLVGSWLKAEINPMLIDDILLYFWLRISTINANVPETFFQKLERNWEDVVVEVHKFIKQQVKK